jgi:glucose/arabinose dehydrogenase
VLISKKIKFYNLSILLFISLFNISCENKNTNTTTKENIISTVSPSPEVTKSPKIDEIKEDKPTELKENTTIKVVGEQVSIDTSGTKREDKSLFTNQNRVTQISTKTPVKAEIITNKLKHPWGLAFINDKEMIITEREGNIRIVNTEGLVSDSLKGVPNVIQKRTGGLMDITLDPDFKNTKLVFWCYTELDQNGTDSATVIAKGKLSEDKKSLENVNVIFRGEKYYDPQNYGSRLIFDKQGFLFVSFGDRISVESRNKAQTSDNYFGKIIRINKDGIAPESNPYIGIGKSKPEIWSLGHRNPQGLAIHPETGELWESEHGPQGGDEINLIQPRLNYGWPIISYGKEYTGELINKGLTSQKGLEQPIYYWNPSIATSGISFYNGSLIPEWKNNLFVTALAGKHISRLVISGNKILGEEKLLASEKQRFRHIIQGPDDALYAITDENEGRIYRISNK